MLYQLSYGPSLTLRTCCFSLCADGQGQNRTADTMIFSHVLYQLSYLAKKNARPSGLGRGISNDPGNVSRPAFARSALPAF